jgi:hypothetical protein
LATNWPLQGGIQGPTIIPQALDLIASCLRLNSGNLVPGSWPT